MVCKKSLLAALFLMALLPACASSGTAEEALGSDLFEIRAWNGKVCKSSSPRATCDEALMPVIKERAQDLCGKKPTTVEKCVRKDAASGDRIYCLARCNEQI